MDGLVAGFAGINDSPSRELEQTPRAPKGWKAFGWQNVHSNNAIPIMTASHKWLSFATTFNLPSVELLGKRAKQWRDWPVVGPPHWFNF